MRAPGAEKYSLALPTAACGLSLSLSLLLAAEKEEEEGGIDISVNFSTCPAAVVNNHGCWKRTFSSSRLGNVARVGGGGTRSKWPGTNCYTPIPRRLGFLALKRVLTNSVHIPRPPFCLLKKHLI